MSDFLVELGQRPAARKLIKQLGLPIPMPQKLRRASGPWQEQPLRGQVVAYGSAGPSALATVCARALAEAGAEPLVTLDAGGIAPFIEAGEAFGRPPRSLDLAALPDILKPSALVFDATGIAEPAQLGSVYEFFHPLVRTLGRCGRVLVLGRPPVKADSPAAAAARAALEGFVRSLAKEIGKLGSTAQLVYVDRDAEDRLPAVLRFFLSARSAFVTGQPLRVTATAAAAPELEQSPPWVRPLTGKVALVTGAARGIGEATARLLAAEGAHVVCLDRPADDGPVSQVARSVSGSVLLADVSDPGAPAAIAAALKERHGGVDIVIHNAGVTRDRTLAKMPRELWNQAIDINLEAVLRITEALLAGGLVRAGGRIICLSSVAGIAGNLGQTNYAASKAGVVGLVQHWAPALAARGITVNAIAPGFIETRLTAAIPAVIREAGRRLSALGQGGVPQDVAEVATFLASPGASGLTGSVLRVCGGAFIGA